MSRNGSGVYSLPAGNPVVTGTTISSTTMNNTLNDIASALTGSLSADGQTPLSGNLNANSYKVTNLANPTVAQDGATKYYVDNAPFTQNGTGSVARTVSGKLQEIVSITDFGASPSASSATNDTAISNAVTYCNTLTNPKLVVPAGQYTISNTASFDLPNYSTIEFIGSFTTTTGSPAIRLGNTTANRYGYYVTGLKVSRSSVDTSSGSVGVQIRNLAFSYIDIRSVSNFQDGVLLYADVSNGGVSYNEIHLGYIQDNKTNLHLQANGSAGGYVNENLFFGGSFNHTSGYPAVATTNIFIDYDGVYRNNNNSFYSPSLEDSSTLAVAAVINGDNNIIFHPRLERPTNQSTYKIQFTANARECQLIGGGFVIENTNIEDLGTTNSYQTRNGLTYQAQAAASSGQSVFAGQSTVTSSAKIFTARNTSGVDKGWIDGNGTVHSATNVYGETGLRYATLSGSYTDRGLFVGSGSPETVVTAEMGSLYVNTAGGVSTTLYVKTSGSGNTGWTAK